MVIEIASDVELVDPASLSEHPQNQSHGGNRMSTDFLPTVAPRLSGEVQEFLVLTIGEIARRVGVELHRVDYIVRSRQIEPLARAGNSRIFSVGAAERIAWELRRIDAERGNDWSLQEIKDRIWGVGNAIVATDELLIGHDA